ncbi:MAG: helix-turn-helix domain-containing protein [Chitinophagaceae bacterium]|jgi:transcriptional regulator with XRE-family HTH domain
MRSKVAQRILENTPEHIRISTHWYADLMVLISNTLKQNKISQKELATNLGKQPSEISKWLKGEHNFTLSSLAKLQAELGVTLIEIPLEKKKESFKRVMNGITLIIHKPISKSTTNFHNWQKPILTQNELLSDVG